MALIYIPKTIETVEEAEALAVKYHTDPETAFATRNRREGDCLVLDRHITRLTTTQGAAA